MAIAKLSPGMQQYVDMKEQYKDCILFFRMGDFYEMFFEDALTASRELEIVLTGKKCGLDEPAPMCGVPYHSVDAYVKRLIDKGYKVAICEQLTEPGKGLVERDVVRIVTPGTVIEDNMVQRDRNNYILAITANRGHLAYAYADVSSGEFFAADCTKSDAAEVQNLLYSIAPSELIITDGAAKQLSEEFFNTISCLVTSRSQKHFDADAALKLLCDHFSVGTLSGFGFSDGALCICAAGGLLQYLLETQKVPLSHINRLQMAQNGDYMQMDMGTKRNLELTSTIMGGGKWGSLLWVLDETQSPQGARMLRRWLEQPLLNADAINERLDGVEELFNSYIVRVNLMDCLSHIYDLERLCAKVSYGTINPRDVKAIGDTLNMIPEVKNLLSVCRSSMLVKACDGLNELSEMAELIESALVDAPPVTTKEGGIIRPGYHREVDMLRSASVDGKSWLSMLEAKEKESTGIKNLKIGFNKVFGYYIEVSRSQVDLVPYRYTRKQTLVGAERYITEELKEIEDTILGAEEKSMRLEYQLFCEIREQIAKVLPILQENSRILATVDALCSLARVAYDHNYTRPKINQDGVIRLTESRHPVVERSIRGFVPNDCVLNGTDDRFLIITGPNMSGKSTYMRQVAIITLMAHIGSFIPAKEGDICLVDRIFTRVGASDDLASGQSTFMVEMVETANILNNATKNSLIILDEIGRGTSTFDGLSIAWSVAEYITDLGSKA
ncbi:MAG: DNA mismatch repair protein MutS, partial [Clostridiales bacterium]|nr:DNA mismatch repair protein MutS [Clostridiales bacterium]